MIAQIIYSFIASFFFALVFKAPKKELFYCGITGSFGWFFYTLLVNSMGNPVIASLVATIAVTTASRFLSHLRRSPSTVYLIPGITPLVPGSGVYSTMFGILNGDMIYSYTKGVETLKLAGVISIGIILVLSLPYSAFNFIKIKDK